MAVNLSTLFPSPPSNPSLLTRQIAVQPQVLGGCVVVVVEVDIVGVVFTGVAVVAVVGSGLVHDVCSVVDVVLVSGWHCSLQRNNG